MHRKQVGRAGPGKLLCVARHAVRRRFFCFHSISPAVCTVSVVLCFSDCSAAGCSASSFLSTSFLPCFSNLLFAHCSSWEGARTEREADCHPHGDPHKHSELRLPTSALRDVTADPAAVRELIAAATLADTSIRYFDT